MKNTFGNQVSVTIFGESHGPAIGAVLDGMAPGIEVDEHYIASQLTLRRPAGKISTARQEQDEFQIVSGVFNGKTTGTPICILIPNTSMKSKDYAATRPLARPGHADYTANCKYHGFEDYRGGGHFSGRVTAALVAVGAIALSALKGKGIVIGSHIRSCAGVEDREFDDLTKDLEVLNGKTFAVLDEEKSVKMREAMEAVAAEGDSVGGVLETAITGLPAGVGEPWFDSLESVLSHILFSVPAIKGVEFGAGFDMVNEKGSSFNDEFYMDGSRVATRTNHNGGINGGISNGMPVIFRCAVKPTPSIYKEQKTVNFFKGEDAVLQLKGRHDPAIIHRARVVVDSVTALALCDVLSGRFGTDYLQGQSLDYGLIGEHLTQSFSKEIHAKIEPYDYQIHELTPEQLPKFMREHHFKAINVTIPYKKAVIPYLDELSETAKAIGAVNTIVNKNGYLYGDNTDFGGMKALIDKLGLHMENAKVLILGTGGTSLTAMAVAKSYGAKNVLRVSRTGKDGAITYEEVEKNHRDADFIINTTPCGMYPKTDAQPISLDGFTKLKGVMDAVYNPLRTRLVLDAMSRGIPAEGGLYMLVAQAVLAAQRFSGRTYPDDLIDRIYRETVAQKENVVLVGMPGCGKSTVGTLLREKLGREFVDSDDQIHKETGVAPAEIIRLEGENGFRDIESAVIRELSQTGGKIIATGGGAVLRKENVLALRSNGKIYFIDRNLEDLIPTEDRPLSSTKEQICALYDRRYPIYCDAADESIRVSGNAQWVADEVERRHKK